MTSQTVQLFLSGAFVFPGDMKDGTEEAEQVSIASSVSVNTDKPPSSRADNAFSRYVNHASSSGHQWNEHEYYLKAKSDMQKHHHEKVAKANIFRVFI